MKKRLLPFILAGALTAAFAGPVTASNHDVNTCDIEQEAGGARALALLIAAAVDANVAVCNISVELLNNSLNNILRNADIDILNNSLNNLLRNADIDVAVLNNNQIVINVLSATGAIIRTVTVNFV
jgi:hypothetical protein